MDSRPSNPSTCVGTGSHKVCFDVPNETSNIAPTNIEREVRERPVVVQEKILPGVREEIQPVIHRERLQTEIHEVTKPLYETNVKPTVYQERMLPAETKPEVRMGSERELPREIPQPSVIQAPVKTQTIVKPPIVEETIRKKIIEEIQPVIHRETVAPTLVRETKPIYEKVIEAPVFMREEREMERNMENMSLREAPRVAPVVAPVAPPKQVVTTTEVTVVSSTDSEGNPLHHHPGEVDTGKRATRTASTTDNTTGKKSHLGFLHRNKATH
jgi:hypothetical protein